MQNTIHAYINSKQLTGVHRVRHVKRFKMFIFGTTKHEIEH